MKHEDKKRGLCSINAKMPVFLLVMLVLSAAASAYATPVYIANPKTLDCKYYFAGDAAHFNPRPESYTITVGEASKASCEEWRCGFTGGSWLNGSCACPKSGYFNESGGCVFEGEASFLTKLLRWLAWWY